jgi:CBS domain-containing protein
MEGAMTIRALLATRTGDVISCTADEAVGAVAARLAEQRIGAVPVVDGDRAVGIFSERDLLRSVVAHGAAALDLPVRDVMASPPVTVEADAAVMAALSLMTKRRFRHLPVVDADGRMIAFISIGDLVKTRIDQVEAEAAAMRDYITNG